MQTNLFYHPLTCHIPQDVIEKITFDFANDTRIPAVLVCLVADVKYKLWNGTIQNYGQSVLLLRRGFEVGAMPGVWSAVAGVLDKTIPNMGALGVTQEDLAHLSVLEEIEEETGFIPNAIGTIAKIDVIEQVNPSKPEQVFDLSVYCANLLPTRTTTPPIILSWEHTGAVWIRTRAIAEYVKTEQIHCPALSQVLTDDIAPNMPRVFGALTKHLAL